MVDHWATVEGVGVNPVRESTRGDAASLDRIGRPTVGFCRAQASTSDPSALFSLRLSALGWDSFPIAVLQSPFVW